MDDNLKAKVIAPYIGVAPIIVNDKDCGLLTAMFVHNLMSKKVTWPWHVLVKPIDNINVTDASELIAINYPDFENVHGITIDGLGIFFKYKAKKATRAASRYIYFEKLTLSDNQFLQGRGYALPYIKTTVEEIFKNGVYKQP